MDFQNARVLTSEGVTASLAYTGRGRRKKSAVRVDYDFGTGGFVTVQLPVSLPLPANYLLSLKLAGAASRNTVQIKLVDQSQQNVWWVQRRNLPIADTWQTLDNKKRHFVFAWGVSKDPPGPVAYIEITVLSGSLQKGHFCLADLAFEELPPAVANQPPPAVTASSGQASAGNVVSGGDYTPGWPTRPGWTSTGKHRRQWLKLDFGGLREFGGLVIDWADGAFACDYEVQARTGAGRWRTIDTVRGARGGIQYHMLPESEATAIRLVMTQPNIANVYIINHIEVKPLDFGASANNFLLQVAGNSPAGWYPRYLTGGEATYWTVVGVSGAFNETLLNEDGMLELGRGMPSLEPFLFDDQTGALLTWEDGTHSQSLAEGYLPLPAVTRQHDGLSLTIESFATGGAEASTVYARYTVSNCGAVPRSGQLCLAVRPFQVNPPWQGLRQPGGHAPVYSIERTHANVAINGKTALVPLSVEDEFFVTCLSRADIVELLASHDGPLCGDRSYVHDPHGFASAALVYSYSIAPGKSCSFDVAVPLSEASKVQRARFDLMHACVAAWWREKLARVDIGFADGSGKELIDTIKAQVAYILINRQGPAIEPGKRNYQRTWIRDGALICEALLQLGYFDEVKDFITWFAPYIFPNGKVPCCVDERGSDPTPENDSHGEFIHLVSRYYLHTRDLAFVEKLFPCIQKVAGYIEELRQTTRTAEFRHCTKRHLYGLLPPSISHEGYGTPAYSYFDDVFALVGLEAAAFLAGELGRQADKEKFACRAGEFRGDLVASVNRVLVDRDIEFIPGAADLGDFDPTSITVWLELTDLLTKFPRTLPATFNRYWNEVLVKRMGGTWTDYTPYELRSVASLLRLNEVGRAHQALDFFMGHRRPQGWRHWAEVVCAKERHGRYIGDMPHTWVGSDFLRSALSFFVYEDPIEGLIVGRGFTPEWLFAGIKATGLHTAFGKLSIVARQDEDKAIVVLIGDVDVDVGVPVRVAVPAGFTRAWVNNKPATIDGDTDTIVVPPHDDPESPPLCAAVLFTRS
jgi:hypothetical protein